MPPDTTKTAKFYREFRRSRGEIACAECRRLKLKCDRQIPCSSCVRRGCSMICPNGSLAGGHGSRYVLSDTQELHKKLVAMSDRIRQLEDALHMAVPGGHALLADDLLSIKHGVEQFRTEQSSPTDAGPSGEPPQHQEEDITNVLDESLGTLAISDTGATRWIGTTGGTTSFMLHELPPDTDEPETQFSVSGHLATTWPFTPVPGNEQEKSDLLAYLLTFLPSRERLAFLQNNYFSNLIWTSRIVSQSQVNDELIPAIYGNLHTPQNIDPHELALMLMVAALGSAGDLGQDPSNEEGMEYHTAARAALSLKSVFDGASLTTIQTLYMMNDFSHFLKGRKPQETSWVMLNMMLSLAVSMGLHRDPSRWDLKGPIAERRRKVFWEIFNMDGWKSLASGRPPFFSLDDIDCRFPGEEQDTSYTDSQFSPKVRSWVYRFGKEVLHPVARRLMSAQPLKQSEVLEMDRKVQEFASYPPPPGTENPEDLKDNPVKAFQTLSPNAVKEYMLLYIHRAFFAKALQKSDEDPLQSPYAASFLSAYRSAHNILKHIGSMWRAIPKVASRCWYLWHHGFCALIVMGAIVAMRPNSDFAPIGLAQLGLAVDVFERAVKSSRLLARSLLVVQRLRLKAYKAYIEHQDYSRSGNSLGAVAGAVGVAAVEGDFTVELAALGGRTRIVPFRDTSGTSVASASSRPSPEQISPQPSSQGSVLDTLPAMHPLGMTPPTSASSSSTPNTDFAALFGTGVGTGTELAGGIAVPQLPELPGQHQQHQQHQHQQQYAMQDLTTLNPLPVEQMPLFGDLFNGSGTNFPADAQSFNEADFYQLMAGASMQPVNNNNSPPGVPQDTWEDLLTQAGAYPSQQQPQGQPANLNSGDFAWTMPATFNQ